MTPAGKRGPGAGAHTAHTAALAALLASLLRQAPGQPGAVLRSHLHALPLRFYVLQDAGGRVRVYGLSMEGGPPPDYLGPWMADTLRRRLGWPPTVPTTARTRDGTPCVMLERP